MRLVALVLLLLLLLPAYAYANEVVQAVGYILLFVPGWQYVGYALIIGSAIYGADQQRKRAGELREQQRRAFNDSLRDRTITRIATNAPFRYVYGNNVRVGSDIVAMLSSGDRDQYKHIVCVHAAHQSESIDEIYINSKAIGALSAPDANGWQNVAGGEFVHTFPVDATESHTGIVFNLAHAPIGGSLRITYWVGSLDNGYQSSMPYMLNGTEVTVSASHNFDCSYQWTDSIARVRVSKHLGGASDPADAGLVALVPDKWTVDSVLRGFTYTVITLDLSHAEFQGGLPSIEVKMNGKLLHDPRNPAFPNDTPVCSSNPALVAGDYLMSEMCGVPWTDLPLADYQTAANVCDETITIDGASVAQYTFNGTISADQEPPKMLEGIAASMAGGIVGTTWSCWAGKYVAPVMALSQDDIVGSFSFVAGTPGADLYNGVRGQYISPEMGYVVTDFIPYQNAIYVEADGREEWNNIDYPFTDSVQRVHNLARIAVEDQRNGFTIKAMFSLKSWSLKPGNRITFTSALLGQTSKVYRVTDKRFGADMGVELTLKEDAASIWDLADAVVIDSTPNTNLPNPFAIAALASLTCSSGTDVLFRNSDGTITSRILAEWPLATTQGVVHGGYVEVEWRRVGGGAWNKTQVTGDETQVYLAPVRDGIWYQVRARAVNPVLNIKSIWLYTTHQVIGKTERPGNVSSITANATLLNVLLVWDEIADPDRKDYLIADDTGGGLAWQVYGGSELKLPPASAGLHTYRIIARDTSKLTSLVEATAAITINAPAVPTVSSAVKDGMVELSWDDCTATHQVKNYEIRYGIGGGFETGVFVARTDARSLRITPDWTGDRNFFVAGVDIADNVGTAGWETVGITVPAAPSLSGVFTADSIKLSWTKPAGVLPVDMYELRYGATWAGGTSLGTFRVTSHSVKADWVGSRNFWVAAIDLAGNAGTPDSLEVIVTAAAAPSITTEVIDNNVLMRWGQVAGTLPTVAYELRKGATWASAELIGTKAGGFTSVFETAGGVYTYWLAAIDSAGNYGTPGSISASVNQPPDYVLKFDYDSLLNGTKSNMALHGDADNSLIGPVNTTETFAAHFTSRGWATPQDQINAGYPVYIQPNLSPAYYEETIDYGAVLAGTRIIITPTTVNVVGTIAQSCKISVSADGSTWTDYDGVWSIYATGFRYVKFRITFTAANGTALIELAGINIRLDIKIKSESGVVAMTLGGAQPQHNISVDYFQGGASAWVAGMSMPPSGFALVGTTNENRMVTGLGPSGINESLWASVDYDVATDADGGWASAAMPADKTKGHIFAVFAKSTTNAGNLNWTGSQGGKLLDLSGTPSQNGIFWSGDLPALNTWYLIIGYVHADGYGTTDTGISGVYNLSGTRVMAGAEYKFSASLADLYHCVYNNSNPSGTGLESAYLCRPVIIPCTEAEAPGKIGYLLQCATGYGAAVAPDGTFIDVSSIGVSPAGYAPTIPVYDFYDAPYPKWFNVFNYTIAGVLTGGNVSWSLKGN